VPDLHESYEGARAAKDSLFAAFATVAKALGNGHRAEIVDVLAQGERSVEELAREIGQSLANTSQHLQVLARAGLVRSERRGHRVVYELATDEVGELWEALRGAAGRHLAEVEVLASAYLGDRGDVEQVTSDELEERLAAGSAVLLDVRPKAEYLAGHIAGARSAPLDELRSAALDLPRRVEVVAYCRGPYCVYADDAVRLLRSRGLRASRLDVGFPEWRRAGRPVASVA
jgi:rhodanese-related sulfurtransferase/predicted transcriptional regulator